ncbi:N-acetyltransferase [Parvibaculaceae bacterium PLY_AMNH_Bact1]|nr:N-acetyltransferase [Parvibaculaceae bacterium PLY_AMNH_Bact1]
MTIRPATVNDVPQMTSLIEAERQRLAAWQPTMWRRAEDTAGQTNEWFSILVAGEGVVALVSIEGTQINGFLIAFPQPSPPVYDPGLTYLIDDFCVAEDTLWPNVGAELLIEALALIKKKGAKQCLSISPVAHQDKAGVLSAAGLAPASTWWTTNL